MTLHSITWKRDPYNVMDRMRDEPWWAWNEIERLGGRIKVEGLFTWRIKWPAGQ